MNAMTDSEHKRSDCYCDSAYHREGHCVVGCPGCRPRMTGFEAGAL